MSDQYPPPPGQHQSAPAPAPASQSAAKMLAVVAGVVAGAMALAGAVFALTRSDGADTVTAESVTTEATVEATAEPGDNDTEPGATEPPADDQGTAPSATEPTIEVSASEPPATDAPGVSDSDLVAELSTINELLAWTSFAEDPLDEQAQQAEIERLISERTVEAVAHPTAVSTICVGIPVNAAMDLTITWQYGGETVRTNFASASPPGVGGCIDNDGAPLDAGSYQVFAANSDLSEIGYATTFVIGADAITQSFLNNTDADICEVGVAPIDTAYYEFFVVDGGMLAPGELLNLPIAAVEQDLAARFCDGTEVGAFVFSPNISITQQLAQ